MDQLPTNIRTTSPHDRRSGRRLLAGAVVVGLLGVGAWYVTGVHRSPDGSAGSRTAGSIRLAGPTVADVSVGFDHACAVLTSGSIRCWGDNSYGMLGNGEKVATMGALHPLKPVTVTGVTNAMSVSAGDSSTCALLADHSVECWGSNKVGELGIGRAGPDVTVPVAVPGLTAVTEVAVGNGGACALVSTGTVECWGQNLHGETGAAFLGGTDHPVQVSPITNAVAITYGGRSPCALLADHTIRCWGETSVSGVPVAIPGITTAVSIASHGADRACALLQGGAARCWGLTSFGNNLGDGSRNASKTPVGVIGISGATAISSGEAVSCAILPPGHVKCWGFNYNGDIGNGSAKFEDDDTPVDVSGLTDAVKIDSGYAGTCAVRTNRDVECWGSGDSGIAVAGSQANRTVPQRVGGL